MCHGNSIYSLFAKSDSKVQQFFMLTWNNLKQFFPEANLFTTYRVTGATSHFRLLQSRVGTGTPVLNAVPMPIIARTNPWSRPTQVGAVDSSVVGTIANLPGTIQRLWVDPVISARGGSTDDVFYMVPQAIDLQNNNPQYEMPTAGIGSTADGNVMASNPVMLYGGAGDSTTEWIIGILEIEAIAGQSRQYTLGIQNTIEVEFYRTRWGVGPSSVIQREKISVRKCMLKQGQITSTAGSEALGHNAVDGYNYQGELPSEDEEEEGGDMYFDQPGALGWEGSIQSVERGSTITCTSS